MSAMNSVHFTSIRNLFKELSENINKFSTLLFALITSTNSLFMKQHKLMVLLVLSIVVYSFLVIIGTILEKHNRSLLPIIICGMLIVGGAASFLALAIISFTVAIITLALWVGISILVVYMYVSAPRSSGLLPL
ncbi:hypothetical protein GYH30_050591 [Glycine max]|nr:hypothetical protein GYH30_050591 [Glycine max]